jgi:hypothetical protein
MLSRFLLLEAWFWLWPGYRSLDCGESFDGRATRQLFKMFPAAIPQLIDL